jgi:pimeloyl-ACP methyl ester carboxylesterase
MAHQILEQLRAGSYQATGLGAPRFTRLAIAGHSVGGLIAQVEAYSFRDVDALVLLAYADQGFTPPSTAAAVAQGAACGGGGESAEAGGPRGYAYFDRDRAEFVAFQFHDAEQRVIAAAADRRNPDPCGDTSSQATAIGVDQARAGEIAVPVLMVYGLSDAVYDQPSAGEQQRARYSASHDVTALFVPNTGHALALERSAPYTRAALADWLARRGL